MDDKKVTPIRPDVKPRKPKRRRGDGSLRKHIDGYESRLAHAVALTRAMGVAFQDHFVQINGGEIDAMDGMFGLADMLEKIRDDMVNLSQ